MIIRMRSTLVIDDELFKRARKRAAELNVTLSDVVNQALRDALTKPAIEAAPFEMPVFGDPAASVHREPAEFAAEEEEHDRSSLRR